MTILYKQKGATYMSFFNKVSSDIKFLIKPYRTLTCTTHTICLLSYAKLEYNKIYKVIK